MKLSFLTKTLLAMVAFSTVTVAPAFAELATQGLPQNVSALYNLLYAQDCVVDDDFPIGPETHKLTDTISLHLVPCMFGAYNMTYVGFITQEGGSVKPLLVLTQEPVSKGVPAAVVPTPYLTNVGYDDKTKILSTFAKGRGLGDCGNSSVSKVYVDSYGGVLVKTTELRHKLECDENVEAEWPVVFKQ